MTPQQRRWEYWKPMATLHIRRNGGSLQDIQTIHQSLFARLISLKFPRTTILRCDLDDPRNSPQITEQCISEALQRRERCMGRIKGKRKAYKAYSGRPVDPQYLSKVISDFSI